MALTKADKIGGAEQVFGVPASHGVGAHEVIRWRSGAWSCNCTDWIIRRSAALDHTRDAGPFMRYNKMGNLVPTDPHCAHVRRCIRGEIRPGGVVYVVPPSREQAVGRALALADGEEV
jgi:hypothetical protein